MVPSFPGDFHGEPMSKRFLSFVFVVLQLCAQQNVLADGDGKVEAAFLSLPAKAMDPTMAAMLWRTSHRPELLNVDYLKHFLGPPDNQAHQISQTSRAYYWHDSLRRTKYELHEEHDGFGRITQSILIAHMPDSLLDLKAMNELLGQQGKAFFDHRSHPTEIYSFAPGTSLSFTSPQNTFAIKKATVTYMGDPLPMPAAEDMQSGRDHLVSKTFFGKKPDWHSLMPWIQDRLAHHPDDPKAHLAYSEALLNMGRLHGAIDEAKKAMALAGDEATRQECLAMLQRMRVMPADAGTTRLAGSSVVSR